MCHQPTIYFIKCFVSTIIFQITKIFRLFEINQSTNQSVISKYFVAHRPRRSCFTIGECPPGHQRKGSAMAHRNGSEGSSVVPCAVRFFTSDAPKAWRWCGPRVVGCSVACLLASHLVVALFFRVKIWRLGSVPPVPQAVPLV